MLVRMLSIGFEPEEAAATRVTFRIHIYFHFLTSVHFGPLPVHDGLQPERQRSVYDLNT